MQGRAPVAAQDAILHATSRSRDASTPLGGIPYVQHVRRVGDSLLEQRREDAPAVVGDRFLQLFRSRSRTDTRVARRTAPARRCPIPVAAARLRRRRSCSCSRLRRSPSPSSCPRAAGRSPPAESGSWRAGSWWSRSINQRRCSSGARVERYFFLCFFLWVFLCLAHGVANLIDELACLPDCASSVEADVWVDVQMLLPRPVITGRPARPPVRVA